MGYPSGFRGYLSGVATLTATGTIKADRLWATGLGSAGACALAIGTTGDGGMYASNASTYNIVASATIHVQYGSGDINLNGTTQHAGVASFTSYLSLAEVASPSAVANRALIYAEDVATKTAARAKVGTAGTVGTVAVEP